MKRYQTDIRDQTLYIETDDGWLEIGAIDDICRLVGGETYSIEYGERQRTADWSGADADGVFTFHVPETLADLSYDKEFISNVDSVPLDETDGDGYPLRTSVFSDLMMRIWDSKGDLEA